MEIEQVVAQHHLCSGASHGRFVQASMCLQDNPWAVNSSCTTLSVMAQHSEAVQLELPAQGFSEGTWKLAQDLHMSTDDTEQVSLSFCTGKVQRHAVR